MSFCPLCPGTWGTSQDGPTQWISPKSYVFVPFVLEHWGQPMTVLQSNSMDVP